MVKDVIVMVNQNLCAEAKLPSMQKLLLHQKINNTLLSDIGKYDHVFGFDNVKLYLDREIVIDANLRSQSEAFAGKESIKN